MRSISPADAEMIKAYLHLIEASLDSSGNVDGLLFNVGRQAFYQSTLRRILNEARYTKVPEQMRRWKWSGGKVDHGLINRRENEIKLFEGMI